MSNSINKTFTNVDNDSHNNKINPKIINISSSVKPSPDKIKIDNGITFPEIPKEDNHSSELNPDKQLKD